MGGQIDLNADMGEGYGRWRLGDDRAMLAVVTSANIACGFHGGDPSTIRATLDGARELAVAVGAHVSYPDLAGFGRRPMDVATTDLVNDVVYQIGALRGLAAAAGVRVGYVKPHGALYNTVVHDARQAEAVARAVAEVDPGLAVLGLAGSAFLAAAERAGLRTVAEAFADRAYTPAGTLLPRDEPEAVLREPAEVAERMARMVTDGIVTAVDGSRVAVRAESICVHGDSPGAVAMAQAVRERLLAAGVVLRPFAGPAAAGAGD